MNVNQEFFRYFIMIYALVFSFVCFIWRIIVVKKLINRNPFRFRKDDTAHGYIGFVFFLLIVFAGINIFSYGLDLVWYRSIEPINILNQENVRYLGIFLLLISLILTALAQKQMGKSWRVGIDEEVKTNLIQTGFFQYSRNPIYLSIHISAIGLFFFLPNVLTLILLIFGHILLNIQIRLEEEHMSKLWPKEFAKYKNKVRRWL